MRHYLSKDGTYVLSKVRRTAIFSGETGIDYKDGAVIAHITLDELIHLTKEAEKRIKSLRKSQGKGAKVKCDAVFSHLDTKLSLFIHEGTLPKLKPDKKKLRGIQLVEELGATRRECLKKPKKKRTRATSKKAKKSRSTK